MQMEQNLKWKSAMHHKKCLTLLASKLKNVSCQ